MHYWSGSSGSMLQSTLIKCSATEVCIQPNPILQPQLHKYKPCTVRHLTINGSTGRTGFRRSRTVVCSSSSSSSSEAEWRWDTLRRMVVFMGPALIIPLGDPLMTLTDTIFIGQCAGTQELAAIGPANIIFSFAQYIFQALQIAAISLISDDLRKGFADRAQTTFRVAIGLAVLSGIAIMGLMELAADQLIAATGANPALVPLSASYMRIRALAQPAVLLTMVCQGGQLAQQDSVGGCCWCSDSPIPFNSVPEACQVHCRTACRLINPKPTCKDSKTPALAVVLSVTVNILCNLIAVAWLGLGLRGAAATTVATQVAGAAVLVIVARRSSALKPGFSIPHLEDLKAFAHTMGPLSVTYVCKNLCYILLQTAAASLSLIQLAAHQAVFSVWNLLAFTTAPLEQAALAYVPAAAPGWQQRSTIQLLLSIAFVIGIACGTLSAGVPMLAPHLLTKDPAVWEQMVKVAPFALVAMLLTAADVGATGVLLARRDLAYVARAYVLTLGSLWLYMWFGVSSSGWGLSGVWTGLVLFFALRCCQSLGRLLLTGISATSSYGSLPAT